jgi:hypothetical protein
VKFGVGAGCLHLQVLLLSPPFKKEKVKTYSLHFGAGETVRNPKEKNLKKESKSIFAKVAFQQMKVYLEIH